MRSAASSAGTPPDAACAYGGTCGVDTTPVAPYAAPGTLMARTPWERTNRGSCPGIDTLWSTEEAEEAEEVEEDAEAGEKSAGRCCAELDAALAEDGPKKEKEEKKKKEEKEEAQE